MDKETNTKIVGVTFGNRQALIRKLGKGESLELVREPKNSFDSNAVAIKKGKDHLGYVKRELASSLAREMDAGHLFTVVVSSITGGGYNTSHGANIRITRLDEEKI